MCACGAQIKASITQTCTHTLSERDRMRERAGEMEAPLGDGRETNKGGLWHYVPGCHCHSDCPIAAAKGFQEDAAWAGEWSGIGIGTPLALSTVNILELPVLLFVLATLVAHLTNTHTRAPTPTHTHTHHAVYLGHLEVGQSMSRALPSPEKVLGKLISTTKISLIIFLNQQHKAHWRMLLPSQQQTYRIFPLPPLLTPCLACHRLSCVVLVVVVACAKYLVLSILAGFASIQTQNGQRRRSIGCG